MREQHTNNKTKQNMSGWNESFFGDKKSFLLWGAITVIALLKYLYESKCGRRGQGEAPIEQDDTAEAQSRNKAAELRLTNLLDETKGPFKATMSQREIKEENEKAEVDVEEGGASKGDFVDNEALAFSNACAICLEEFEEDDMVVRSVTTKEECPHIFHEPCLKEVITATTNKGIYSIPCPCCRQTFVEIGAEVSA